MDRVFPGRLLVHASDRPAGDLAVLHVGRRQTRAGLVAVPVGADGRVRLTSLSSGKAHLRVEVQGWSTR